MRDLSDYTKEYIKPNFEDYQIQYRRRKIIEELKKYNHARILEIGCGMEPLFKYLDKDEFTRYVVVEPSLEFYENAYKISGGEVRIIKSHASTSALDIASN